jgi:hypothetical protein
MKHTCPDCGVLEGEIHHNGCSKEICPLCFEQLLTCDCEVSYDKLNQKGRIPYLYIPRFCALCGNERKIKTDDFMDKDWHKYVPPIVYGNYNVNLQEAFICKKCYERLKKLFPDGWRK